MLGLLKAFGRFWYDFIVGEDWRIAVGVVAALAAGAGLVAGDVVSSTVLVLIVSAAIVLVVGVSILRGRLR